MWRAWCQTALMYLSRITKIATQTERDFDQLRIF
jgi:hypothetical protein